MIISTLFSLLRYFDEQSLDLLKPHVNKIICIHLDHFAPYYFQIQENSLAHLSQENKINFEADLYLSGALSGFINMIQQPSKASPSLQIQGDLQLAQALFQTWKRLDLEWEKPLYQWLGYPIADGIVFSFRQSFHWLHSTWEARKSDLGAYLQDEIQWLPSPREVENFLSEVDKIRLDVERFEAKLKLFFTGNYH
jgi:ubiquinone biosynthesis protein UbiJ